MESVTAPVIVRAPAHRTPGRFGLLSRLSAWWLARRGWRIEVAEPIPDKCVIIVYPHTSNWDFPVGLLAKWAIGLTRKHEALCFAGKEVLFRPPWGWFFRAVGGFPVNRKASTGFVDQMAARFATEPRMRFVLAPEGTRSHVPHMRSSFYYVALAAKVPIALGAFDFSRRRIVVDTFLTPCGDATTDLAAIERYYRDIEVRGYAPENAGVWRFRD
ncbi:MAG: 1-acyl-sn-glycerol-3-phosphate acyltransferase [Burkholderiales bacterium]|nr:1-acyl-sn-glycerol-3-phosphate acyltransferase [Pseudomonadota bacterium]MCC7068909.1 1-acyl-sn-glycerol-3-phosphate acyltransferase [Burkholderiales bacterium]